MMLLIDAGNTNVVMALHDSSGYRGIWRIATDANRTSDEYAVWLLGLLQHCRIDRVGVTGAVIGTVVPAALYHLRRLCRDWFQVEPLVARPSLNWGFRIDVDRPEEVGADRLLNALAAGTRYGGPAMVIDFGTATTFDVVGADGAYQGGVICPGIQLSIKALHHAAARLPRIGIGRPQSVVGRNTVAAMQSGIYWGYVAMVEGLVARIGAECAGTSTGTATGGATGRGATPAAMRVIATGGLAPLLAEGTTLIGHIDPDLTLDGLRLLAERNPAPTLSRDRTRLVDND
jgi:type III pantothenate kinase